MVPFYWLVRLSGRCANGAQRGGGSLVHVVPTNGPDDAPTWGKALCGARPGRLSGAGFVEVHSSERWPSAPTCPRCIAAARRPRPVVVEPTPPTTVRIPRRFVVDYADRALPMPGIVRATRTHFFVDRDDPALDSLVADAQFYAEGNVDGCADLVAAARALVQALKGGAR